MDNSPDFTALKNQIIKPGLCVCAYNLWAPTVVVVVMCKNSIYFPHCSQTLGQLYG